MGNKTVGQTSSSDKTKNDFIVNLTKQTEISDKQIIKLTKQTGTSVLPNEMKTKMVMRTSLFDMKLIIQPNFTEIMSKKNTTTLSKRSEIVRILSKKEARKFMQKVVQIIENSVNENLLLIL